MKKLILFLVSFFGFLVAANSQAFGGLGMNYQAVARDAGGQVLAGKNIRLRAALIAGGPSGNLLYSEIHQVTTSELGLFNLAIGQGKAAIGDFAQIPWSEKNIWLEMAIAEENESEFTVFGASRLLAVPYAFHAGSAEMLQLPSEGQRGPCSITGLPFWSIRGNDNVDDECHFIGTRIAEDLVFRTNWVERMRIGADGGIDLSGDLHIGGDLIAEGDGTFFNLNAENDLAVANHATVNSLEVSTEAAIEGQLSAKGRVIVDGGADGSQSEQDSYPLLVRGSTQGIAVEVDPATTNNFESGRGNNYMSFWKDGQMTGRIEGMNPGDLDPTGLVSLITNLVSNPPSGVSYNFGSLPINVIPNVDVFTDVDWGIFLDVDVGVGFSNVVLNNPFNNYNQGLLNYIQNPTGGPASLIWNQFTQIACDPATGIFQQGQGPEAVTNFKSQVFSNYTLDILTNSISVFGSIVELAASAASVFDPEDIANEAIDLVVDITNLVITGSYADVNLGVAYESGAGDYAEWLPRAFPDERMSYGDVVGVIGGKVSKKFTHAPRFMVVSASPIVLGNMPAGEEEAEGSEKIAFMGQVPAKVYGKANIGDYLLPSGAGDGLAIAVSPENMKARDYQRIVGVAWEASDGTEFFKMVNTAVGLNHNDTGRLIEELQAVVNRMQKTLQDIDPGYQAHFFDVEEQEPATQQRPDYSVAPTHPSRIGRYFEGKEYGNRREMLQDVKKALTEVARIDLGSYPLVAHILDHPEEAPALAAFYAQCRNGVKGLAEKPFQNPSPATPENRERQ
ncbi:MAG: hypothetical protein KDD10_16660 [Phaeodactylibacter sp.]|nr:hypothetical protein [Phaeodactylibacter sp.]